MIVSIQWQQLDANGHKSGMRLECHACKTVQYFGDDDISLYKARDEHNCIEGHERRSAIVREPS